MDAGAETKYLAVKGFYFKGCWAHVALMVAALVLSAFASAGFLRPLSPTISTSQGNTFPRQKAAETSSSSVESSERQWQAAGGHHSGSNGKNLWGRVIGLRFSGLGLSGTVFGGGHTRELSKEEGLASIEDSSQSDVSLVNHAQPGVRSEFGSVKPSLSAKDGSSSQPLRARLEGTSAVQGGFHSGKMAPGMKFWDDWVDATDMEAMWARPDVLAEWTAAGERRGQKVQMSRTADGKPVVTWTEMWAMAEIICERHFKNRVDPLVVCCVAEIESARQPLAYRFEPGLGEASTGMLQTLQSTAEWLAHDMGYRAYSVDWTVTMLYKPFVSVYFGAAYLNWLSTYKGKKQSEEFIIRGYNGGPNGIHSKSTEHYWRRYLQTKANIPRPHLVTMPLRSTLHQTPAAVLVAGDRSAPVASTSSNGVDLASGGRYLGPVVRQQPEWTYWEERASADDLEAMWQREDVRREWQKAGEKVGSVRFSRDDRKQPYLTRTEVIAVASIVVERHFQVKLDVMSVCALLEASSERLLEGKSGPGVMQVELSTATWLHRDMGFHAYPIASVDDLKRPFTAVYYGAAYMSWLSRYGGRERGEEFIVRGYRGGPNGVAQDSTLPFWEQYKNAKIRYMELVERGTRNFPCSLQ